MTKKILITGGAGFVGHHFIEHILKNTDWRIVCLDRLDCSGNLNRLTDMAIWETQKHRVKFFHHDLRAEINDQVCRLLLMEAGNELPQPFDYAVHFAAGSHVDRSISDPLGFFMDNTIGSVNFLNFFRVFKEWALKPTSKIIYFSTDEVFGPAPKGVAYKEWDRYNSGNPYSAAKAGGEEAALAFANTYKLPIIVTHTMNIFGERQHPEKFIPLIIKKILKGETMTIHSNKEKTESGTRYYLHVRNVSSATMFLLENGKVLDGSGHVGKYNIVGDQEVSNLHMAQLVHKFVNEWEAEQGLPLSPLSTEMVDFHSSRPGHDLRYALDGGLIKSEGWVAPLTFEESLKKTVYWTLNNKKKWLM
jgi:dTDP-glucose 4,6-dehydratase